jgi:signal transduction histidine kinase
MRLKYLLISVASISGTLTCGVFVALLMVLNSHYDAMEREAFADKIVETVFQLSSLTGEYLLHRDERPRQQWLQLHHKLNALLTQPDFDDAELNPTVALLREDYRKIQRYFADAATAFDQKAEKYGTKLSPHEKSLANQLQTSVYAMASHASAFSSLNREVLKTAQIRLSWLMTALIIVILGNLAALWFVLAKRVIIPLHTLHNDIQQFDANSLNKRLDIQQADEIGELANSFNMLASQLQNTLVSREVLAQTVADKTRELQNSNIKLRELARLKDEFLAGMSHELRTPLNAILATSEMLLEPELYHFDTKTRRALHNVQDSGQHLLDLINDVLDVSKISAGKLELELSSIEPESVCHDAVDLVLPTAEAKNIEICTHYEIIDDIVMDKRRIKQVLVNLLANAIKFTPNNGQVGLRFSADSQHHKVHFEVWDTGIGIEQDKLDKLFQPFVQLDSSLSRKYSGTGLGLALVKSLVDLHGGSISVESTFNQGSHFCVSLPWRIPHHKVALNDNSALDKPQDVSPNKQNHPQHVILIVDDNSQNLEITADYLQLRGFRAVVAHSGAEAIRHARECLPNMILMDIQMPDMDGIETIRRLRTEAQFARTPIVALTALAMPGDRERCLASGADEYLSKPISLHHLVETLERLL